MAEKLCEALFNCLLGNLVPHNRAATDINGLPWLIMEAVDELKLELYLSLAVSVWAKENKVTKAHITRLVACQRVSFLMMKMRPHDQSHPTLERNIEMKINCKLTRSSPSLITNLYRIRIELELKANL